MTIRLRTLFFLFLGIATVWFLWVSRAILSPFILGAIFAYIFNPTVNFFTKKIKLPRTLSIIIVYFILISFVVGGAIFFSQRVFAESSEVRVYLTSLLKNAKSQISTLPYWIQPTVVDLLENFNKNQYEGTFSFAPYFPQAVSEFVGFIIFIFSGFYFLKEGSHFLDLMLHYVPRDLKLEVEILIRKINHVLGAYLRGQIFLIFLMAFWLFLALMVLGIRFALIIAIFSGIAEIVPVIGPIVATAVAVLVAIVTGTNNFSLPPLNAALVVVLIYFLLRHIEDYFVIPIVMGKITKLPPFIIFFAVIAGGHLAGMLGLILAVPVAAVIRILLEFCMDHINKHHRESP